MNRVLLHAKDLLRTIHQHVQQLNFYSDKAVTEHDFQCGRVATRLYISLLVAFLLIFILFSSMMTITQTITIQNIDFDQHKSLLEKYPDIICTCKNIDITYLSFIKLKPIFHQVCLSDYVGEYWMYTTISYTVDRYTPIVDWRRTIQSKSQLLAALCNMSQAVVTEGVNNFLRTKLITLQLTSDRLLFSQISAITEEFYSNTEMTFARYLDLNSLLKQADSLVSGLSTNYQYFAIVTNDTRTIPSYPITNTFTSIENTYCTCKEISSCVRSLEIQDPTRNRTVSIPGWYMGCYVYDSLMRSTLECFYSYSCLTMIRYNYDLPFMFQPLSIVNNTRFPITDTVGTIARHLFVEDWGMTYDYSAYYAACSPSSCSYTISQHRDFLTIFGTLIGVIGGLTKGFDIFLPRFVRFIFGPGKEIRQKITRAMKMRRNVTVTTVTPIQPCH